MTKNKYDSSNETLLTFGGHLEVLRRMLFRILGVLLVVGVVVFCLKDETFGLILAPTKDEFCFYGWVEDFLHFFGSSFRFEAMNVQMISTELSTQFMTHLTSSIYVALLLSSPYILFELFGFIAPALYENEKRSSKIVLLMVYLLFILGVLISYFILFPLSFRFLVTYQVESSIENTITISSYISTFTTLTLMVGVAFQLPIVSYILGRMRILSSAQLKHFRRYALFVITILSAVITPPDIMSCFFVMGPLYLLYECSIYVVKFTEKRQTVFKNDE